MLANKVTKKRPLFKPPLLNILGVIPARYQSTRFPGKPLVEINGKSMIQHVYERASQSTLLDLIIVATDDERIFDHVRGFGAQVLMTSPDHISGTDRVAEVARAFPDHEIVINIQGDEPFLFPEQLDQLARMLVERKELQIATLARPFTAPENLKNPNLVKVVLGILGQALYFSRQVIPFVRDTAQGPEPAEDSYLKHIGLYAFRREVLMQISQLPQGRLEQLERLEQLRWLAHGYSIHVGLTNKESRGVDTPEDLEELLKNSMNE